MKSGISETHVFMNGHMMRKGYTTGSCAAAAAKAAVQILLSGNIVETVNLITPKGTELHLEVEDVKHGKGWVSCAIRKDAGDDCDITDGALVYSKVAFSEGVAVIVDGGKGVGRITKKGLNQPPGAAAINSIPR